MSPTLDPQERHLMVKVIDKVLHKLGGAIRPHAKQLIVVVSPMLIDRDYYTRVEGR